MKKYALSFISLLCVFIIFGGCFVYAAEDSNEAESYVEKGKQSYKDHDYKKAREYYSEAASLGSSDAMVLLGNMYSNGEGGETDCPKAFEYYSKAAELENPEAYGKLGECYLYGIGTEKDNRTGLNYLRKGEEADDPNSIGTMGYVYKGGFGKARDYNTALEKLKKAAEMGQAWAMKEIACIYNEGEYVAENKELAKQYFQDAIEAYKQKADEGDRTALFTIGTILEEGLGTEEDKEEALKYYKESIDLGYTYAYGYYGDLNINLNRAETGIKAFQAGSEQGSAELTEVLAYCYLNGKTVAVNTEKAEKYYKQAFELYNNDYENTKLSGQSRGLAANGIARLYDNGSGVEADEEKAFFYHQEAANLDYVTSMLDLGAYYENKRDYDNMIKWWTKAYDRAGMKRRSEIRSVLQKLYDNDSVEYSKVSRFGVVEKAENPDENKKGLLEIIFDIIGIIILIIIGIAVLGYIIEPLIAVISFLVVIRGFFQIIFDIAALVAGFNILKILMFNLHDTNIFYGAVTYYDKSDPLLKTILFNLAAFDAAFSFVSFFDHFLSLITRKRYMQARIPVVLTIIAIIIVEISKRKKKFYCQKCSRNMETKELLCVCNSCTTVQPVKYMNLLGTINCRCTDPDCMHNELRTTFSRINPYGRKNSGKRSIICKNCSSVIGNESVINITVFTDGVAHALPFLEDFFYHAFGKKKIQDTVTVDSVDSESIRALYTHYERGIRYSGMNDKSYSFSLRDKNNSLKKDVTYYLRIAAGDSEKYPLVSSEGTIILLQGSSDSAERQKIIDNFILELGRINGEGKNWKNPILIGICADNTPQLESLIDKGIVSYKDMEKIATEFLRNNGNDDILYTMPANASNVHYFIYHTGANYSKTSDKVFNVIPPVQALMYSQHRELMNVWKPDTRGIVPAMSVIK